MLSCPAITPNRILALLSHGRASANADMLCDQAFPADTRVVDPQILAATEIRPAAALQGPWKMAGKPAAMMSFVPLQ
jgi:hypothetical protein